MAKLGKLDYVMQLSGPPVMRRTGLLGVFDPYIAQPWLLGLGVIGGIFLAMRSKRRR